MHNLAGTLTFILETTPGQLNHSSTDIRSFSKLNGMTTLIKKVVVPLILLIQSTPTDINKDWYSSSSHFPVLETKNYLKGWIEVMYQKQLGIQEPSSSSSKEQKKLTKLNLPWFTNSVGLLVLPWGSRGGIDVLIDETLLCVSISQVLLLQKSSEMLAFLTVWPRILSPLDGLSTAIISGGLVQHPRQPLLCCKSGL